MQDPRDDGGRGVEELEVGFEGGEVCWCGGRGGPEEWVVVGEEGEEDAEEEGGCWVRSVRRVSFDFDFDYFWHGGWGD